METFTRLKKYFRTLGLLRLDSTEQFMGITMNCLVFVTFFQHTVAIICFIPSEAQTFREYVESFYCVCYALHVLTWYTIHFLNRNEYNRYFVELNEIIASSKLKLHSIT